MREITGTRDRRWQVCYSNPRYEEWKQDEISTTLRASGGIYGGGSETLVKGENMRTRRYSVRRLTPAECLRLQGYPDGWLDIGEWIDENGKTRPVSDTCQYKAIGNSIALPQWRWLLRRISATYERNATMGSLFDGIGGFPFIWQQYNGDGSCKWASEIEPFCIAVTEKHFGENGDWKNFL